MLKIISKFFDRLEDKVRGWLSRRSILYGIAGGVGIVLFWRGVWHTADFIMEWIFVQKYQDSSPGLGSLPWWDGPLSLATGTIILLITGIFVSSFIGNEIILSGLRGEKKLAEKTESEVKTEVGAIADIRDEVRAIHAKLSHLENKLSTQKNKSRKTSDL